MPGSAIQGKSRDKETRMGQIPETITEIGCCLGFKIEAIIGLSGPEYPNLVPILKASCVTF